MYSPQARRSALADLAVGRTLSAVSRRSGVSRSALREWSEASATELRTLRSACPRDRPIAQAPYAHLLGLYLGDGSISSGARGVFALRISCDAKYPALVAECVESMSLVSERRVSLVSAPGCAVVKSYSRHWPCLFPQHGDGLKHDRVIALSTWQSDAVVAHPESLVRGLFHSDGCRVINWTVRRVAGATKRYEYPRYLFSNESEDILGICEWALDLLGIRHTRSRRNVISVARRPDVRLMDVVVGPKR
jgi:hypothetical protein